MCKYCDIREDVPFVCRSCRQRMHKKEHAVVRHFRRAINVPFKYDESPGFECTRKRPDIRFEMDAHDVIVEVDENQHRGYEESCECARISEIVGAIGGKSVVFIRYNPDNVRCNGARVQVTAAERIDLLVATVKAELARCHDEFSVRVVQLWFDSAEPGPYEARREMDITHTVAV
jgi:very-short-patch-repair endonuclease